jgi:hypothetical protein
MPADELIAFTEVLRNLAGSVSETADATFGSEGWQAVRLDVRWLPSGQATKFRLRAELPDGSTQDVRTSPDVDARVLDLTRVKGAVFPNEIYGALVEVTRDGDCEVTYNYDPDHANDPSFED